MSGIAGIHYRDGRPVDGHLPAAMIGRLDHRGGTDAIWTTGSLGLASTCSTGSNSGLWSGRHVLVADARLDNRSELCRTFYPGHEDSSVSDAALIAAAYEKWGEETPLHLLGDFAFVLWDRERHLLFCARDPFGVRPFYYHLSSSLVAFGSEIKALRSVPEIPDLLNEDRIAAYLTGMPDNTEATFYSAIRRLPPAHSLIVSSHDAAVRRYWSPDGERELRLASDEEYAEAFHELFVQSVQSRMGDNGATGAFLSGGLDSSAIVCAARDVLRKNGGMPIHTFSGIFPGSPECDERRYVDAVVEGGDIHPHFLNANAVSPMHGIEELLLHHDEPFFAPNMFVHAGLYSQARSLGIDVMLDGFDGDTVVSHGAAYLAELARAGKWRAFMLEVNGMASNFNIPKHRVIWRRGIKELMPQRLMQPAFALRRRQEVVRIGAILNPDLAHRTGQRDHTAAMLAARSRRPESSRQDHLQRLLSGLIPFTLEVLDRTASFHSVEPRYPFFDRRLAEFCLALPGHQKVRHGWTRSIMRRALAPVLPEAIRRRGGKGLPGGSFARNLLAYERSRLDDLLLSDTNLVEPFVDMSHLRSTYSRYVESPTIGSALQIWRVATLALWMRGECQRVDVTGYKS